LAEGSFEDAITIAIDALCDSMVASNSSPTSGKRRALCETQAADSGTIHHQSVCPSVRPSVACPSVHPSVRPPARAQREEKAEQEEEEETVVAKTGTLKDFRILSSTDGFNYLCSVAFRWSGGQIWVACPFIDDHIFFLQAVDEEARSKGNDFRFHLCTRMKNKEQAEWAKYIKLRNKRLYDASTFHFKVIACALNSEPQTTEVLLTTANFTAAHLSDKSHNFDAWVLLKIPTRTWMLCWGAIGPRVQSP